MPLVELSLRSAHLAIKVSHCLLKVEMIAAVYVINTIRHINF